MRGLQELNANGPSNISSVSERRRQNDAWMLLKHKISLDWQVYWTAKCTRLNQGAAEAAAWRVISTLHQALHARQALTVEFFKGCRGVLKILPIAIFIQ